MIKVARNSLRGLRRVGDTLTSATGQSGDSGLLRSFAGASGLPVDAG